MTDQTVVESLNSLRYLVHQRSSLLQRLQSELSSLSRESQLDSDALLLLRQRALDESLSRLAAEERENASLRHSFQSARMSTDQLRMKTEIVMQHKARLYDTIHTVVATSTLMLKASDVESAKLSYVAIGRKDTQEMNLLQLRQRRDKARSMATALNEFLAEKAQKQLLRSNLDEKLKLWKAKIDRYSALALQCKAAKTAKRAELSAVHIVYQRILTAFKARDIEECIQKYERILSSNESLSSYINNQLVQLAEQRAVKRNFKSELRVYHHGSRTAKLSPSGASLPAADSGLSQISLSSSIEKDLLSLQILVFDAISSIKSTLTRFDRADGDAALGPHYGELILRDEDLPGLEHSIGTLLLLERKVWQCQEISAQRLARKSPTKFFRPIKLRSLPTVFISPETGRKSILHTIDLKFTSQSVNNIRSKLFSSHFVADAETESSVGKPAGKIGSLLSDVAKVHFEVSSNLRLDRRILSEGGKSPKVNKEIDDAETAFLHTETKRMKKGAGETFSRQVSHKHSLSLPSPSAQRTYKLSRGHSEFDAALGIPQISRQIQELNRMAVIYQKSLGHTESDGLKELYQSVCQKKNELRKMKKLRASVSVTSPNKDAVQRLPSLKSPKSQKGLDSPSHLSTLFADIASKRMATQAGKK